MYTRNNALQIIFACRKGRFTSTKISCKQVLKAGREGNWFERRHAGSGMQKVYMWIDSVLMTACRTVGVVEK
jgi:hypothetical protein